VVRAICLPYECYLVLVEQFSWQFRHQLGFLMLTGSLLHTLHDHHCEQLLAICGAGTADETALLATWSARQ